MLKVVPSLLIQILVAQGNIKLIGNASDFKEIPQSIWNSVPAFSIPEPQVFEGTSAAGKPHTRVGYPHLIVWKEGPCQPFPAKIF